MPRSNATHSLIFHCSTAVQRKDITRSGLTYATPQNPFRPRPQQRSTRYGDVHNIRYNTISAQAARGVRLLPASLISPCSTDLTPVHSLFGPLKVPQRGSNAKAPPTRRAAHCTGFTSFCSPNPQSDTRAYKGGASRRPSVQGQSCHHLSQALILVLLRKARP